MKSLFFFLSLFFIVMNIYAQPQFITTKIGKIAVFIQGIPTNEPPIIFLHGVYFDHHLWDNQVNAIKDRSVITIDMPLHGESKQDILANWTLNDCADMLLAILDSLHLPKVIAVGHSWGSMTILRAATQQPDRFAAIGLCNMPFEAASKNQKRTFGLQHSMLFFRYFYTQQAGKALFGKTSLRENPALIHLLKRPMNLLTNAQIKQTDKAVIINAEDATALLKNLQVKALALKGEEDYVPTLPSPIQTIIVKGGHISPLEKPQEVLDLINRLLNK
jgi:pimeloyl-ACP methyl ester carboxylesterase